MKHDLDWDTTSESYDPLTLIELIDKTIFSHIKDQYWYATVYDQECALYVFRQHKFTNEHYYEKFNTKVNAGEAIGITRQHRVIMEYTSQEKFKKKIDNLSSDEKL